MDFMILPDRLIDHFIALVQIDSLSRKEREIALRLKSDLESVSGKVFIDDAGDKVGGNVGNLIARIPGNRPAPSLLLSAHMDTVVPGQGIRPIRQGESVRSDGRTILGGDDKSGIAAIMEAIRVLHERNLPHGDIEVVFTVCEEVGLIGAKHLDMTGLHSREGLVFDCVGSGSLYTQAPACERMEFTVHGLEAHAGVCPERGVSAIVIAAEAISGMRLGRIDEETTANVGVIQGGQATNIVPNLTTVQCEVRSHSAEKLARQTEQMRASVRDAAARHRCKSNDRTFQPRIEEKIWKDYERMAVPSDARIVRLVQEAGRRASVPIDLRSTGGGCDANIFNQHGITVANLATGMHDIHTVHESVSIPELTQAAEVLLQLLLLNVEGD